MGFLQKTSGIKGFFDSGYLFFVGREIGISPEGMLSRGMLVALFLFLAVFGMLLLVAMPLRQGVEGLEAAALAYPFLLACGRALAGLFEQPFCLGNRIIEAHQKTLVVGQGSAA